MKGGEFDYKQYTLQILIDQIEEAINKNNKKGGNNYTKETINEFKKATDSLIKAFVYTQRIDWLLSGDDSEKLFHKRLNNDLGFTDHFNNFISNFDKH